MRLQPAFRQHMCVRCVRRARQCATAIQLQISSLQVVSRCMVALQLSSIEVRGQVG